MAPFSIDNPSGLWALIFLVPLIILYLIRPKPKTMAIPSLMFFLKSTGSRKLTSFLKQITHDWLFLIQLILLAALAITFAQPYTNYEHDVTASNTVLVIDVSASSQVYENGKTRFEIIIDKAKDLLGSKNTIVLAKNVPYIALQDATSSEAAKFLNQLEPKATPSHIGEAIILAGETLKGEGRVAVVSDFINTGGQDPEVAKAVVESRGIVVDFVNIIGSKRKNVGIVQMDAENAQTTIYVKNYNPEQESVPIKIGSSQTTLNVPAKSIETYSFATPSGVTEIKLGTKDDFPLDNTVYLSAPDGGKAKVLYVSNNESNFLKNALLASGDIELTETKPPVIPREEFDVIVLNGLDPEQVLPGTFDEILAEAQDGATVVVAAQQAKINYEELLPVKLGKSADGGFITVEQLNRFTKNIDFGKANMVLEAELIGDHTIIATVNSIPVITIKKAGAGKIVYFGILEDSDFKFSPHYPIFWTELLKFVTEQQDVRNLNLKTGETLILDEEQTIKTPTKSIKRAAFTLDENGIYQLEDRILAVNLVNEYESSINAEKTIGTKSTDYELHPVKETRKFSWAVFLIGLALFLALFEIYFIKSRGDL